MPYEKSVGAVVFKTVNNAPRYLLLQHPSTRQLAGSGQAREYWNFPKGLVERGEEELETAQREIKEETGLEGLEFIDGFRVRDHYVFRRKEEKGGHKSGLTVKDVFFYLARAKNGRVRISWEHKGYVWLPYEEAMKRLEYPGIKKILEKAHAFLQAEAPL